jgi:hypothetical protein
VRRALPWLGAGLGVVLAAAGVAVFWATNLSGGGAGGGGGRWAAYAPLEPGDPPPPGAGWQVSWTGGHLLGAALLVAGLLVLAAVAGWLLGRRSARR